MEVDKTLEYRKQEAVATSKIERGRIKETRDSSGDTDQMKRNSLPPLPYKKLAVKKLYHQSESFHSALYLAFNYECALRTQLLSRVWLFTTPWTAAYDPMDCRLLCPWNFPGKNTGADYHFLSKDLLNPGIKPASLVSPALAGRILYHCATWETLNYEWIIQNQTF